MANYPGRIAPDTGNLMIGKGFLLFQPTDTMEWVHLGNCPKVTVTPKADTLMHYDSMAGTKKKDKTFVLTQTMEVVIEMEEATADNLRLLFSGDVDRTNPLQPVVHMLSKTQVDGHLRFYAANDIGPRWYLDLPSVTFYPSGGFEAVSDQLNTMQVTGTVNFYNGTWGDATLQAQVGTVAPENLLLPFIDLGGDLAPEVGTAYLCKIGGWIGATSFTFQWKADGVNISGATSQIYTPVSGDTTKALTCAVTGHNAIGTAVATSAATPDVV